MSLRLRITILFTVILTVALAVFGNFMYDYLENSLIREIDKSLQDKAVEIFKSIKILDSYPIPLQKVILPDVNIFAATPDIYLEVIDTSGTPVASSDNLSKQS
jgi:two-component system OmpR family sensor kinase